MEWNAETYVFVSKIRSKVECKLTFSCSESFGLPPLPPWHTLLEVVHREGQIFDIKEHALCSNSNDDVPCVNKCFFWNLVNERNGHMALFHIKVPAAQQQVKSFRGLAQNGVKR